MITQVFEISIRQNCIYKFYCCQYYIKLNGGCCFLDNTNKTKYRDKISNTNFGNIYLFQQFISILKVSVKDDIGWCI